MNDMTESEMLELAAKAAGMHLTLAGYIKNGDEGNPVYSHPDYDWNPLTDDGDALRLAVKLGLLVGVRFHYINLERFKTKDVDDATAIRRAITCAAAEIGRNMP